MLFRIAQAQKHCWLEKIARTQPNTKECCWIVKTVNLGCFSSAQDENLRPAIFNMFSDTVIEVAICVYSIP